MIKFIRITGWAFIILLIAHSNNEINAQVISKITGITMVAPPRNFSKDPMPAMKELGAKWVAIVPYAFTPRNSANVRFGSDRQWWGEREDGIVESIRLAKKNGMKVMLKPQVWLHGSWVGEMDFETEEDWKIWEVDYENYIMSFVDVAVRMKVEIICIGTELKIAATKREEFWRDLIAKVRRRYDGLLTYSANWDDYKSLPFWDVLDVIGISVYFPLSDAPTPNVYYLKYKWGSVKKKLKRFSEKLEKPILFTEYGYLSVDGCAHKTWELERKRRELNANERAQSNALEALYSSFWAESWWAGGFLWKWYPNGMTREERRVKDYTPQGKISEKVIKKWYQKSASSYAGYRNSQ